MHYRERLHFYAKALYIQFQSINHLSDVESFLSKSFFIFPPLVSYKIFRRFSNIKFNDFRVMHMPNIEAVGSLKASLYNKNYNQAKRKNGSEVFEFA